MKGKQVEGIVNETHILGGSQLASMDVDEMAAAMERQRERSLQRRIAANNEASLDPHRDRPPQSIPVDQGSTINGLARAIEATSHRKLSNGDKSPYMGQ